MADPKSQGQIGMLVLKLLPNKLLGKYSVVLVVLKEKETFMGNGGMVGAGVLLIIIGLLLLTGILQFLITVVGWIAIIAGVIVGVIGLVSMIKGGNRGY